MYAHYVRPSGGVRKTESLGRASGQCGYLLTRRLRIFPFSPAAGRWVLQVDTQRAYARHPVGPVGRIYITVS